MKSQVRVALAEYHSIFLYSLQAWTATLEGVACAVAARTQADVLKLLEQERFDVLVLDLGQTWPDTLWFLRTLRQRYPALRVVLLLTDPSPEHLQQALAAGARALLSRHDDIGEYHRALQAVADGLSYLSRQCLKQFSPLQAPVRTPPHEALTAREAEVVRGLMRQLSSEEIATELTISLYTVKTHRRNILRKMNLRNTIGLLRAAAEWERSA